MMNGTGKTIAVFGSSRREEHSALYREAFEVGGLLARAGYAVLTGGYGGSMAAASRGACAEGGHVIGVTCAVFEPAQPNPWVSEEIRTASLLERLAYMIARADGYVGLRGGIGTLSEVTLVWSLLQTRTLDGKPLVLVGTSWQAILDAFMAHTDLGRSIAALARVVADPAGILNALAAPPAPPGPPPLG